MQLLLLSNSSSPQGFLTHALPAITEWAQAPAEGADLLFVPYAGVTRGWDDYAALVADALRPTGLRLRSLHDEADPDDALEAIARASHIVVGGGNTFALVRQLRQTGQLAAIAERVRSGGARYLGWSAGANLACPGLYTSNDMPIVDPQGFDTLGLVPFQINPHYTEAHPEGHRGETRQQRLREFALLNPGVPVLGLPEGTGLRVDGAQHTLLGDPQTPARWFTGPDAPAILPMGPWKL
ncbi:dipeptidase PepE [Acidovorax sp. Be4]|uniref:Dipeptidase PepE n=1 Tax=Acidovorax bellezanensis TaxID=2976702 RepID=A0ABT2PHC7_9BURK|nr:dipeptidase PepE [Acidovorax sp. Be4]MCT9809861.1 dipeptidase PepE [Acidovorax sp. Be4]